MLVIHDVRLDTWRIISSWRSLFYITLSFFAPISLRLGDERWRHPAAREDVVLQSFQIYRTGGGALYGRAEVRCGGVQSPSSHQRYHHQGQCFPQTWILVVELQGSSV